MNLFVMVLRGCRLDRTTLLTLLLVLIVCGQRSAGEMRKSWQAKSVDVQVQLLKAARTVEEAPSAKPPETTEETVSRASQEPELTKSDSTGSDGLTAGSKPTTGANEPVAGGKVATQFSSRVRSKNGPGSVAVPVKVSDPDPEPVDRAVPLHLEHPQMEEIQVDDATVQDDDDEEEEDDDDDDDDDDDLGWNGAVGKNKPEKDLIENILEEVEERLNEPRTNQASQDTRSKGTAADGGVKKYTFPPVLNMTIDEPNSVVKVKLNHDIVRDMINTGRSAGGGGIGGKKMLRYVIPLFILPFLIQSAVIPFMLTAVKLFLLKSLMAGKVAIFLLLLGAFKNFTKKERDVYVKDVPDRRYEPSSEGFAYLAEGRPSNWVN